MATDAFSLPPSKQLAMDLVLKGDNLQQAVLSQASLPQGGCGGEEGTGGCWYGYGNRWEM